MGIGTDDLHAKLEVDGTGKFTNDLLVNGNVGIGTSGPQAKLDVNGTSKFDGNLIFGSAYTLVKPLSVADIS